MCPYCGIRPLSNRKDARTCGHRSCQKQHNRIKNLLNYVPVPKKPNPKYRLRNYRGKMTKGIKQKQKDPRYNLAFNDLIFTIGAMLHFEEQGKIKESCF